jgi:uncharacterized protein YheU (UPF0270 family)
MVQIPMDRLSDDVLDALIEEFVSRDGTDLADAQSKIAQVRTQLRRGQIVIVYDEESETTNIVPKDYDPKKEDPRPHSDERRIVYDDPT